MVVNTRIPERQQIPVPPVENPLKGTLPPLPDGVTQSADIDQGGFTPEAFSARRANAEGSIPDNTYAEETPEAARPIPRRMDNIIQTNREANDANDMLASGFNPDTLKHNTPYEDVMNTQYKKGGVDRYGNEMSMEELDTQIKDSQMQDKKRTGILSMDWRTQEELANSTPNRLKTGDIGTLHNTMYNMGQNLASIKVYSETERGIHQKSALDTITQSYGISPTQAANGSTVALTMVMPILSGATTKTPTESNMAAIDQIAALVGGDFSLGAGEQIEGGLKLGLFKRILGSLAGKLYTMSNHLTDEQGRPIDRSTTDKDTRHADETGESLLSAAVDGGLVSVHKDDNGIEFVRINPLYGDSLYNASRELAENVTENLLGETTSTPVSDTGQYRTAQRNIRPGNKGGKEIAAARVDSTEEVERIAGSTPLVISPVKSWMAAALFKMAMGFHSGQGGADTTKHAMINMKERPGEDADVKDKQKFNRELKTKVNIVAKLLKGYAKAIRTNLPQYAKHKTNPTTGRLSNDVNNINLQRHIVTRAVTGTVSVPVSMQSVLHKTGVSAEVANKWWEDLGAFMRSPREDFHTKSAHMVEMNFLYTIAHALDIGKYHDATRETGSYLPADLIRLLTPQRMREFADFGKRLKSIVPQSTNLILKDLMDPSLMELTPEQKMVMTELVASAGKKEWGFYAQACIDLDNYLAAKENGTAFTPRTLTAIDMNSAGRATLAMDVGNLNVLERVGLIWKYVAEDDMQNTLPHGSPRNYFINMAIDTGVEIALSDSDAEHKQAVRNLLQYYKETGGKSFIDDFGKKVLMTSDYGKPAMYHQTEVYALLDSHPEFAADLMKLYGDGNGGIDNKKQLVKEMNDIFYHTLRSAGDLWQQEVPKSIVKLVGMFGKSIAPKGFYGEQMFIGGFIEKAIGESVRISGASRDEVVMLSERVYSAMAKAKNKNTKDEDGNELPEPGEGTLAINQMGPIMGQYRESVIIALTMLYINKGKSAKDILFSQSVFDNLILDSNSMAQFVYVANNIITPQVLSWDIQENIKADFLKKTGEGMKEIAKDGYADIGRNGKQWGTTVALDREWKYMDAQELTAKQKKLKAILEDPNSGYIPPGEDNEAARANIKITPEQFAKLYVALYNNKMFIYSGGGNKHRPNVHGIKGGLIEVESAGVRESALDKWVEQGLKRKREAMKSVNDLAKHGRVSFFS